MVVAQKGIPGIETEAFGADPSQIDKVYQFRYVVVDLDDVIPSHTDTMVPNPEYPQELQPRLRDRAASRTQIENIARNLNPRALLQDSGFIDTGPMIVGSDMVVESGNGRVLALRKAAKDYPEQYSRYKNMLETISDRFGIDREKIASINNPILVRERISDVDRVAFAAEANVGAVMGMSPYEQALQDAGRLSANVISNLTVGEEQTIDQALRARNNDDIVKHFLMSIPSTERAVVSDEKGSINQQGLDRLKLAIFAKTYTGDAGKRLVRIFGESADPQLKSIENAMFASLPDMAKAESLIDAKQREEELSIAPDLAEVIDTFASLKATGMSIPDYLSQLAMFEERLSDFQKKLLEHIDDTGRKSKLVREMLRDIAQQIVDAPPKGQVGMLGLEPLTKEALVYGVINKQREELGKPAFPVATTAASREELEEPDTGGDESAGRLQSDVGTGVGETPELAEGTPITAGLGEIIESPIDKPIESGIMTSRGYEGEKEDEPTYKFAPREPEPKVEPIEPSPTQVQELKQVEEEAADVIEEAPVTPKPAPPEEPVEEIPEPEPEPEEPIVPAVAETQMMGIDVVKADTKTVGDMQYELYKAVDEQDNRGIVRVLDKESGKVATLKAYPDYNKASEEYEEVPEEEPTEEPLAEPEPEPWRAKPGEGEAFGHAVPTKPEDLAKREKARKKAEAKKEKKETAQVRLQALRAIHEARSELARESDERQQHSVVIEPDSQLAFKWEQDGGSMDIRGVDTMRKPTKKVQRGRGKRTASRRYPDISLGSIR